MRVKPKHSLCFISHLLLLVPARCNPVVLASFVQGPKRPSPKIEPTPRQPYLHPFRQNTIQPSRIKPTTSTSTSIPSLLQLVEEINQSPTPRTIFVGGKGGVGKTSISSALAIHLASSDPSSSSNILIVSTDPAHSLGDALDVDLSTTNGAAVTMTDPLTMGRLHALEIDPLSALETFRSNLAAFDVRRLSSALGISEEFLMDLGWNEFDGLLSNPPPGLDELVALSEVLMKEEEGREYDCIVVDTAPTGHTLRMLALPQFLDGFLGKLLKLRAKLSGLASTIQALMGSSEAQQRAQTIDNAVNRLEKFRNQMSVLRTQLADSSKTNFVVVTIPTKLGIAESRRLMEELGDQGVKVSDVVVNQCVVMGDSAATTKYYERRKSGQNRWISELRASIDDVSSSKEYKSNENNGGGRSIALTKVPFFDVELVGVPALAYLGRTVLNDNPNFDYLMKQSDEQPKFIICGGKGGVGKTTTSSALAISMAAEGHDVALISTDPAHSLGDALDMNLSGGNLQDCPLLGVPPTDGSLKVMEIDPSAALAQFKSLVDQLVGKYEANNNDAGGKGGSNSDMGNTIREFSSIFDTLPAGTDEVVALAKVVNLIKKGDFDRIVLDTAPTGHTLRMLSTPSFVADLIERVLMISKRINSNAAVKMFITSMASKAAGGKEEVDSAGEAAKSALLSFQLQMYDLEDLFSDVKQTEFLIVTIATELAVRESVRLLNDLTFEAPDMPIKVRNVVVNQVLDDDGGDVDVYLRKVMEGQRDSIVELKKVIGSLRGEKPVVTEVPFLDTEPRGVFGLKALAQELIKD